MSEVVIKVPPIGESITEATIARWIKKPGDAVAMDELVVELETDKVTLEVAAPAAGILASVAFSQGATVKIGDTLAVVNTDASASASASIAATPVVDASASAPSAVAASNQATTPDTPSAATTDTANAPSSVSSSDSSTAAAQLTATPPAVSIPLAAPRGDINDILTSSASPSVRKLLAEKNLNAADVTASRLDGRLTKEDVNNPRASGALSGVALYAGDGLNIDREERRMPMSRLRLRVAERLKSAQNTAAILTTFNEVDMTAVKQLRDRYKDAFEKSHDVKLGFMSFFVKACVQALQEIPMMNSRIEGEEIITSNYCDIGVAVSAPNGLVVPVLRDADLMDIAEIEKAIAAYGKKARDNKLSLAEMTGGTFTISNGGVFGSLLSTPIINPPQSGILGMHKIQDRPVAINGNIEIRPMMYLALSYDHRLIDGREAVTFLCSIKDSLENPGRFLLGV
jgi:2-oxoglutarate dehydrogenase E2 component (dihydrolipoamide succinyltransferase)